MAKKKQEVKLKEPVRLRFKQLANGNFASCTQIPKFHYENGWYHILSKQKDSIAKEPIVTVKDFVSLRLYSNGNRTYVMVGQTSKHKFQSHVSRFLVYRTVCRTMRISGG